MAKRGGTFLQRRRVPLGFLCAAAFVYFAAPTFASLAAGGAIAVVGLLVRAWAAGHIRKNQTLTVSGPYARTRNPLYFGSFLLGIGFTVAAWNWWLVLLFAGLFLGIYFPVMRAEARDMQRFFPADFADYSDNVPLFLPRVFAWRKASNQAGANKFDFALYMKYREYQAALGTVFAWSLLLLKAVVF